MSRFTDERGHRHDHPTGSPQYHDRCDLTDRTTDRAPTEREPRPLPRTPTGMWLSNLAPELWKQAPRGELMEPMQIPIRDAIIRIEEEAAASPPATETLPPLEKIVADMPWPASCRHCDLVTEDPDAYFMPPDIEATMDTECYGSPSGVHEARTLHDYALAYRAGAATETGGLDPDARLVIEAVAAIAAGADDLNRGMADGLATAGGTLSWEVLDAAARLRSPSVGKP